MSQTSYPLAYAQANRTRFVTELKDFVRFPSVSAQSKHSGDIRKCAQWLANHLHGVGLERVKIITTRGHPLVYAEWLHVPAAPTVIIYGHYDVQPSDPLEQWRSPPFEPVERGDELYGRGTSDDKGQMFAHIKALECYLRTAESLPVNVKCLFEGEEEIGSPNFASFLQKNRKEFAASVAVVSDTAMLAPNRPSITYSMRGALSLELKIVGPETDLHDGLFGGVVRNPVQGLCDIVAGLQTIDGRIAIPGFYDEVREISGEERAYMATTGHSDTQLLRTAGIRNGWGEPGYTLYERATIRPAMTVSGITAGYQGPGPKAIIPAMASAKLNFRLVPDQNPIQIDHLFREHVARLTPFTLRSMVRTDLAAMPILVDRCHPLVRAAAVACKKGFESAPVFLRSGGTNPAVSAFHHTLGLPTTLMGFALPDDNIHAPNERFHLPNFHKGIETSIWYLNELGTGRRVANVAQSRILAATRAT